MGRGSAQRSSKRTPNPEISVVDDAWIRVPPKAGSENKIIKKDGKKWNWCKWHEKYVIVNSRFGKHTSETCTLNPANEHKKTNKRKATVEVEANAADEDYDSRSDNSQDEATSEDNSLNNA